MDIKFIRGKSLKSLKVIVTVKTMLCRVKSIAVNYDYASIRLNISNDEIRKIIQSDDFRIKEPAYVDRI